jgi:Rrf2 family protein
LKVSSKSEYACLALIALAQHGASRPALRTREIAELQGIPRQFLSQILLRLKVAGLVRSHRGATGGYRLSRPAEQISLAEILTAIDGADKAPRESRRPSIRELLPILEQVRAARRTVLESATVATLVELAQPHDWVI